jgi:hypothetical protein
MSTCHELDRPFRPTPKLTFERGGWTLEPHRGAGKRIVDSHPRFCSAMR